MYQVEEIDSRERLDALAGEWRDLSGRAELDLPFNRYEWYRCWWDSFQPQARFSVLAVRRLAAGGGRLVAVLPLMRRSAGWRGLRRYRIWSNTHSFRTALLADPAHPEALVALSRHLVRTMRIRRLELPYLVVGTRAHDTLKQSLLGERCSILEQQGMRSPVLRMSGDLKAMLGTLSRRRRESLRRKLRKLEGREGYRYEITGGRVADLGRRLQDCWHVSSRTWKHARGSSIASDPRRIKFYECLSDAPLDWLVLAISYVGKTPIAFEYNLRMDGTLYNLKLGYDEHWREHSPGIVLRLRMLEWAYEQGIEVFDYMGNSADYKEMLSTSTVDHENLEVFSPAFMDRAAYLARAQGGPYFRRLLRPARRLVMGG